MEKRQSEAVLEEKHLEEVIAIAKEQLQQAHEAIEKNQQELKEIQQEIRENAEQRITNLSCTDDFEALVALNQYAMPVNSIVADCDKIEQKKTRLEKLIKSPYFARIDFLFEGDAVPEKVYIGRSSLSNEKSTQMYIYDWRSPIASVFYRFMLGKAFYEAPCGRVNGEVTLKRQYEIKERVLCYFFDTDMNINDDILKQLLSKNTSPQMKAIVETIQKEQDIVIRNMESELLMIQGVAGSGKTSIALHRAAYLMYQGLQNKLSANNILIISPNPTFEHYIANVLPELGEENVVSVMFEDMLRSVLKDRAIPSQTRFFELSIADSPYRKIVKGSMDFKTSETFKRILDRFVEDIPLYEIDFQDIYLEGQLIASQEKMRSFVCRRKEVPLAARLEQLENRIVEDAFENKKLGKSEKSQFRQELQKFTKPDVYQLYVRLWEKETYFKFPEENGMGNKIWQIRKNTLKKLQSNGMYYDDAIAILYLYLRIYGSSRYRNIRQVIIDEAQDYYPLQYEIFRMLFPGAKFTVLGDINQTLGRQEQLSFYEAVQKRLGKEKASLVTLDKSFRCTNEILQFSLQFMKERAEMQSFNRSGDNVTVMSFDDEEAYVEELIKEIEICREKGLETVCLLCKTAKSCKELYSKVKDRVDARLITGEEVETLQGILIIPSYMAKGLEFDAVLICDADAGSYRDEEDRNLLYIECTRALHRLSLYCMGKMTDFVKRPV